MASLETTKKFIESMEPNSFLRLVADVLFKDINNLGLYKAHEMYYVDDVVLIPAGISGHETDKLFICNRNGVTGNFQAKDWRVFTLVPEGRHSFIESKRYTANTDNTSRISLGVTISYDRHNLTLTHSVRGRLKKDSDWRFTDTGTIELISFTLFEGEWIDVDFYE